MKGSIPQVFVLLSLIIGCGFKSVNRTNTTTCTGVSKIEVDTPPGFADWSNHLRIQATRQFEHRAETNAPTTLRVKLTDVDQSLSNFNSSGHLSGTTVHLRVSVDLVQGTRMLWTAQSEPFAGIVQHTGTPRITTMNMNETMKAQITDGIRTLGRTYRQQCTLASGRGDKP